MGITDWSNWSPTSKATAHFVAAAILLLAIELAGVTIDDKRGTLGMILAYNALWVAYQRGPRKCS